MCLFILHLIHIPNQPRCICRTPALTKTHATPKHSSKPTKKTGKKTNKHHQTPPSPPAPLPWGEGSMLHKKQKPSLKPTERPGQTRHTKPHKPMNCERAVRHRRTALSQFGGRGGTGPPTKKNAGGDFVAPHTKKNSPTKIGWLSFWDKYDVMKAALERRCDEYWGVCA